MRTIPIPLASLAADPSQPRRAMRTEELEALASSLRERGQLLPLRVRKPDPKTGLHVILSGHRRHAALKLIGAKEAACVVVEEATDPCGVLEEQLVENLVREDLSPLDEAEGYRRYIAFKGCTAGEAARALHVSDSRVSRALRLLELPEPARAAVREGKLSAEAAYHVSRMPAGSGRDAAIEKALRGGMTRDEAVRAARGKVGDSAKSLGRVLLRLPEARTLCVSGTQVTLEGFIHLIEEVLKSARKARTAGFQTTARSARCCTVYLTQGLHNYLAAYSGSSGRADAMSMLGNLTTHIVHSLACHDTAQYIADLVGRSRQWLFSGSTMPEEPDQMDWLFGSRPARYSGSFSEHFEHEVQPNELFRMKTGGPANAYQVEGLVWRGGHPFPSTGTPYLWTTFSQRS